MSPALVWVLCAIIQFCRSDSVNLTQNHVDAYCNDGSKAVFYLDSSCTSTTHWMIALEGGGGCSSEDQCIQRLQDRTGSTSVLTSSLPLRRFVNIKGRSILSSNAKENPPFHDFCHVLVPYCSSDFWLGNTSTSSTSSDHYQGARIFEEVITKLLQHHGLNTSKEVVLFGLSAGGVGALNQFPWLSSQLPPDAHLSLIIDSGWFINFKDVLKDLYSSPPFVPVAPLCRIFVEGVPCCAVPSCVLLNYNSTLPPIFFISSRYDAYLLQYVLENEIPVDSINQNAENLSTTNSLINVAINTVYSYGSAYVTSAKAVQQYTRTVSFFVPSCSQHNYMPTSSLWDVGGPLREAVVETVVVGGIVNFTNAINPSLWRNIQINGTTLLAALTTWYQNKTELISLFDSCQVLLCNEHCQDSALLIQPRKGFEAWEWVCVVVAILLAFGPAVPKVILYINQKYLFHQQKLYIRSRTVTKPGKHRTLPASVSCSQISYTVNGSLSWCETGRPVSKRRIRTVLVQPVEEEEIPRPATPKGRDKVIINNVNLYINPGELVAIMGPSGSGKTTLLDVILGRRTSGTVEGDIYIQGIPLSAMKEWFRNNSAYVRQLTIPYYTELTVRQNLLLAANMQVPPRTPTELLFERVEQVISETGLQKVADIPVGEATGLGLSGGQKKRLCIALQMLKMPSVLFLDEPTTGLDAATSKELLEMLYVLTQDGHSVLLTIHQPRIEIFHMFHKIILLTEGEIAYFGSPFGAYSYFKDTLSAKNGSNIKLEGCKSAADALLDILNRKDHQRALVEAYKENGFPQAVQHAIDLSQQSIAHTPTTTHIQNPGIWKRLLSLESRTSLRQTFIQIIYIPVVFLTVATLLCTVYYPANSSAKVVAVVCLTTCCPSLLMSSMVMGLLLKPLTIFDLEHSDGISSAHDLVLQVFIRMAAISCIPLAICMLIISLVIYESRDPVVITMVILYFLLANLAWITIFIFITVTFPSITHRICPLAAALGSFFCGFIIPRSQLPLYYIWILYIDPSYYAFSGTAFTVLGTREFQCPNYKTNIECYVESGLASIYYFGLTDIWPSLHLVYLIGFVFLGIVMAILSLNLKLYYPVLRERINMMKKRWVNKGKPFGSKVCLAATVSDTHSTAQRRHKIVHEFNSQERDSVSEEEVDLLQQQMNNLDVDSIMSQVEMVDMIINEEDKMRDCKDLLHRREEKINLELATHVVNWIQSDDDCVLQHEVGLVNRNTSLRPQKTFKQISHKPSIKDTTDLHETTSPFCN